MDPVPASPTPGGLVPDPKRAPDLEELLFRCLESRAAGDGSGLDRLLAEHVEHAPELRRLLAVVDGMETVPPAQLGEYELLHGIGGGGMGVVLLARQPRLRRLVAIKLIRPELLGSAKTRERFLREARALAHVTHPGICPIYDFGEDDGQPYLVMQYVAGEPLSSVPPPADRAGLVHVLRLGERVCEAVQAAHDAGLVHRDLKPQNVVLSADGRPVVLDFGLARLVSGPAADEPLLTTQTQPVGTPAYMAPERLTGAASAAGPGVDVYALGVMLYQLLTGALPFHSPVLEALWSQVLRGELPLKPLRRRWLPRDLEVVVRTAMARDPGERYDSARSLGEDLRRVRLGLPILARRPSAMTRVMRWTQRNRLVAALLVGLAAAVIGAAALVARLSLERAHNRSLALAGESARHGVRSPALRVRLALAALGEEDGPAARGELAQGLADWQLRERLLGIDEICEASEPLPTGGIAVLRDRRRVLAAPELGGRREFERPDGGECVSFAVSPDGALLALGGADGRLWLIDPAGVRPQREVRVGDDPITKLRFGPDSRTLAIATDRRDEILQRTASIYVLAGDALAASQLESVSGENAIVLQFEFTPDGERLIAVVQGQAVLSFRLDGSAPPVSLGAGRPVLFVALVREATALVCGCRLGALLEVPVDGGEHVLFGQHPPRLNALALSPDGHTLATGGDDRTVRLWDLDEAPGQRSPIVLRHPAVVTNVAFRPDGRLLATGCNDFVVRVWDLSGDEKLALPSNLGAGALLRFEPQRIWLSSEENGAGAFDLRAHGVALLIGDTAVTAMLPNHEPGVVWTGGANGTVVRLSEQGATTAGPLHKYAVIALARSADDRLLLSVDENVTAFVHDLATDWQQELTSPGGILVAGWFLDGGQTILLQAKMPLLQATLLARYRRDPGSGEFALDGEPRRIAEVLGTGSLDPTTGRLLLGRPAAGGFLAVDPAGAMDDIVTPGPPCARVLRSPDGALLATCLTSEIALWRSGAEQPFAVLPTDSSKTAEFAFSPDGQFLGAISKSGAVWMHSTADGELLWSGRVPAIGWSLAFSEDGAHLLTGDSDCVVRHWLVEPAAQVELALHLLSGWRWTAEETVTLADNEVPLVPPSR